MQEKPETDKEEIPPTPVPFGILRKGMMFLFADERTPRRIKVKTQAAVAVDLLVEEETTDIPADVPIYPLRATTVAHDTIGLQVAPTSR
jgi:hypothetical protein